MKKDLKQVRPEDFDAEALMAAAREGRLYVDEGINQVCSKQVIENVRANVVLIQEGEIGPDDVHLLIETVNKLSDAYERLAKQVSDNVREEPNNSQTKPVDNHVPSFDEMMQVFKKAKSEGLWNCKRSWGVGYQMWKIWGWKGTAMEYVHLVENYRQTLDRFIGPAKSLVSGNTLQIKDYDKTDWPWTLFDPAEKQKRHETVFPEECRKAFDTGAAMAAGE